MKKLKSLTQKIENAKRTKLEGKIQRREKRISHLKEIDACLAEVLLPDVTLNIKTQDDSIRQKLNHIQTKLVKAKKTYEIKTEKHSKTSEKKLNDLQKKLVKSLNVIEAQIQKTPKENEMRLKALENKKQNIQAAYESKKKKMEKAASNKAMHLEAKFRHAYESEVYKYKVKIAHLNHKNKMTNDSLWWLNLPKSEKQEKRTDLSFYRPYTMGYVMTLLSVVAELVYALLLFNQMERTFWVGIAILANIGFLLLLFTIAIKIKNYKRMFGYVSIGFGLYCILRISYIIQGLMNVDLSKFSAVKLIFIYGANVYMIVASIFVGIHAHFKIKHQMKYLSEEKITKFQLSK